MDNVLFIVYDVPDMVGIIITDTEYPVTGIVRNGWVFLQSPLYPVRCGHRSGGGGFE